MGRIECTPGAGNVYLDCTNPVGRLKFVTCGFNRTTTPNTNQVALVANTLNIANTNVYLTDRGPDDESNDNYAGGQIEFRGDFISRSQMTNDFRLEHTTVRAIGNTLNTFQYWECMSKNNGAGDPSTNNFALGKLVLGQTSAGSIAKTELVLNDLYTNHTASAGTEAVYVTNLTMYARSELYLNGCNLYYKNSGAWQRAVVGYFTYGDGTGRIRNSPKKGTVVMID